jgi:hypothetical protein
MIDFVQGPNKEPVPSAEEQAEIIEALQNCDSEQSYYFWLNCIYNNFYHFSNQAYSYYPPTFLQEVAKIARSRDNKIIVMGNHHSDTGHTSGVIFHQPNATAAPYGCFVQDTYIRFTMKMPSPYKLSVLNEFQVFHFLTNVPKVSWTVNKRGMIIVHNIPSWISNKVALDYYPAVTGNIRVLRSI